MDPAVQNAIMQIQLQMQHALQTQQAQHAAEMLALQGALHAPAAAAPAARAGPSPAKERLALVPDYTGVKSGLEEWIKLMERQYDFYEIVSEADRLRSAAAKLSGPSLDWWNTLAVAARPATWTDFKAQLALRFQPITAVEIARTKLFALRQGKMLVNEYVAAFRNLVALVPGMDAATVRHLFTSGLNVKARQQVAISNVTVLEDIIAMAVRIGAVAEATEPSAHAAMDLSNMEEAAPRSDTGDLRADFMADLLAAMNLRRGGGRRAGAADGAGADRPREPRAPPTIKGLTPVQVKKYMDENRCFGCNEVGHQSRHCPQRKMVDGRATWSSK